MVEKRGRAAESRRIRNLQERCDRLAADYEILKGEKQALENELEVCRAKLVCVEKAEDEFRKAIAQTKQIREQYERAYEDLRIIKSRYSNEVTKLINQLKH